jgi:hypothetical protein
MGRRYQGASFLSFDCRYQGEISTTTDASPSIEERSLHWGGRDIFLLHFQILVCYTSCKVNMCTRTWSQDLK